MESFVTFFLGWAGNSQTHQYYSVMTENLNNIYRYGALPVESRQAGGVPGPMPRKGPPLATGGHHVPLRGARHRRRRENTTGQNNLQQEETPLRGKKMHHVSLNILQLNICGLRNKKTELAKLLHDQKIHVALLQETLHREADPHVSGYTCYACECRDCRGIATYIRNDILGDVEHLPRAHPTDVQKITIWHAEKKYTVYNIYNPPQAECKLPDVQETHFKNTILAGDFNGHSPLWGYRDHNKTGLFIEELCGATNLILLQNSESAPTLLHRAHLSLSRPDLTICSADIEHACHIEVLDDLGSDHKPILTTVHTQAKLHHHRKTRWNFAKANWDQYQQISDLFLSTIEEEDVDKFNEAVVKAILQAASQCIPRGSRKNFKPFWNEEIQQAVTNRKLAREVLQNHPCPENRAAYNKTCAIAKLTTNTAKKTKWHQTCADLNLQQDGIKAWNLLNNLSGTKSRSNPKPMHSDGSTMATDQKKAEHFNRFFASVNRAGELTDPEKERLKQHKKHEKAPNVNNAVFDVSFTEKELKAALQKLRARKSPGPDKIHGEMLQKLGPAGKNTLLRLFNHTWQIGKVPRGWKNAHVVPILKKDKPPTEPKSFRPISLTSCIGKLMERMINRRLYWYLEKSQVLGKAQAGFRKGKSTEDQLFLLTQKIQDGFQLKKHSLAVFVDLQQAYDRVWRKGLLEKMLNLGIHGKLYRWIKFFLTDRTIQTKVNNSLSSKEVLEEGLPQGSCLSCTLFLIYICDLEDCLHSNKALYADDLVMWITHTDISLATGLMRRDLKRLEEYCKSWKLKISESKTVYTIFSKSSKVGKSLPDLKINNKSIQKDDHPIYLGMELDRQLTLKQHAANLKRKASKRLQLLKKLGSTSWGADKTTLRNLYLGYVRSSLEYGAALLTTCSQTNLSSLDKVQNNALRFINGGMRSTPIAACEIHANVEPLGLRREKAAFELYEKIKRSSPDDHSRKLVERWQPKHRIQQQSMLHHVWKLKDKHHLPEQRLQSNYFQHDFPPYLDLKVPETRRSLKNNITKKDDPVTIMRASLTTIDSYPDEWIHAYTDGSAFKGTTNAGCGAVINFPDGSSSEISYACGVHCSNYDAEIAAIEATIYHLKTVFDTTPAKAQNVVIFTDSMSALQSLDDDPMKPELKQIILDAHEIMEAYDMNITMQWIPGHSNTPGNDQADKLAKKGSRQAQPHNKTTLNTAKQILKSNIKQDWLNRWALGTTGRILFQHMAAPTPKDNINHLPRKDQATIFRLRTHHAPLNQHLCRIGARQLSACHMCGHPEETVEHHLFECHALDDLRSQFLPPQCDTNCTLYGTTQQLRRTCTFHYMALSRRAKAQELLDQ